MKILFFSDNFPPETNAAATRVYERAVHWAKWGHQVTVITSAPNFPQGKVYPGYRNEWYRIEYRDAIRIVRVKTFISANKGTALRMLDFLSFMATGLAAAMVQPRFDVVAATSPQFFAAVAGWLTGLLRRRPFVFELGDIWPASIVGVGAMKASSALRLMERLELFLYRRSACVVALTEAFRTNLVSRGIPADKICVVRNGVDLSRYQPREQDTELARAWGVERAFVFGYVGTHGMAHNLRNVLDAAERLRQRADIRILLVGDGAEREELVAEAKRRGLTNVVMMGPQPKDAMPKVWSLCDVALVHLKDTPVFAEVIPSKIFEAMGMGKPILLSVPRGEASAIVEEDGAGLWVEPDNPDTLAAAMARLADDDALRRQMAAASLAAASRHSRTTQAEEMLQALEIAAAGLGAEAGSRLTAPGRSARSAG